MQTVMDILRKTGKDEVIDMFNLMNRFTLDSIGQIGFARNIGSLRDASSPFLKSFDRAQQIAALRFITPMWQVRRILRVGVEAEMYQHIRELSEYSLETVRMIKANDAEMG